MSCVGKHEELRASDDDAAFREYVLSRSTALLRTATKLTGNRADAEDLVQAALAKIYLSWGKINDRTALDAYVRRATVNTHISWWRRRRLEEYPTNELPDQVVADPARESDMAEVVRRAWTACCSECEPRSCSGIRGYDRTGNRRNARDKPGYRERHGIARSGPVAH